MVTVLAAGQDDRAFVFFEAASFASIPSGRWSVKVTGKWPMRKRAETGDSS
jgi:hypothetical protein